MPYAKISSVDKERLFDTYRNGESYSPFLSIVENFFSIWKAGAKRRLAELHDHLLNQTHQERMAAVAMVAEVAITDLTVDHAVAAFRHLSARLTECFDRVDMFV